MGKLFFSRLIIILSIVVSPKAIGQEYYCVFKVDGNPLLNDSIPLQKGVFINSGQFLKLNDKDEVVLLDEAGTIYELDKKMYIPFKNIEKFSKRPEQTSFTLKYFRFIWNKLWQDEQKDNIGVVFRANLANILLEPVDSVFIYKTEVVFNWLEKQPGETNYIFIRNTTENDYLKLSTNGSTLTLPVDDKILKSDNSYYWSVSSESKLEIKDLNFHSYSLLGEESFNLKISEFKEIWQEFQALGFTDDEIKKTFCEDKGLCFD